MNRQRSRQVEFDACDLQRLSRYAELQARIAALPDTDTAEDHAAFYALTRERDALALGLVDDIIGALNIEPPVIDDSAPAQVDIVDQAIKLIDEAQIALGEDRIGSVPELLVDNLPGVHTWDDALALVRQVHLRGVLTLHLSAPDWNDLYEPGQPVSLTRDDGTQEYTRTRSVAWTLGSGVPVVKVEGRTGGYLLSRIQPLDQAVPT